MMQEKEESRVLVLGEELGSTTQVQVLVSDSRHIKLICC